MWQKDQENENRLLRTEFEKRFEAIEKAKEDQTKRELTLWQTVGIEAIKYLAFGAGGGGVIVAVIKLFGITV